MVRVEVVVAAVLARLAICDCQDSGSSDDNDDDIACLPKLADRCFSDLYTDISQYLTDRSASPAELCSAANDGLQCASTIIDGDCNAKDGRGNFDMWMSGLNAVYDNFCQEPYESLRSLTEDTSCWNLQKFVNCVEEETKLTHIIDLLQHQLDINSCNSLLVSMAACNARATSTTVTCRPHERAVAELLHTFFSATRCGLRCPGSSSPPATWRPDMGALFFSHAVAFFFHFR
ncbi:uncharacterized protein LOC134529144 [Bacillus rossius redtenbacheri]|uniref:uncharacterized protein LOC134529144 n=1 Tax=Bacillus rossius redtenbacheri TaxID=93214 RepID=UPI002FDD0127